ncbi:hypothetical protein [Chitinivibrio alkaliphilus]|uniref:Uncharacterized protein n=1 Tax=Chitinivibrio alkaliphilus ACht1 TaxID=1313304 RepID=U7D9D1_9BACT|nr:hypothetical protein [Chitinivibrio alkaliphilus]ERP38999.1 hypothetical protein CALK_0491 [Chitinivibrio alkaliphilus ACht1]
MQKGTALGDFFVAIFLFLLGNLYGGEESVETTEVAYHGFHLGAGWQFGSCDITASWVRAYTDVGEKRLDSLREMEAGNYRLRSLQDPGSHANSFSISLGYTFHIDSLQAISVSGLYGFSRKTLSYEIRDLLDTSFALHEEYRLWHHRGGVRVRFFHGFLPELFSISGYEQGGISFSAGLRTDLFSHGSRSLGWGGLWGASLYGVRQSNFGSARRISLGYEGGRTISQGSLEKLIPGKDEAGGHFFHTMILHVEVFLTDE